MADKPSLLFLVVLLSFMSDTCSHCLLSDMCRKAALAPEQGRGPLAGRTAGDTVCHEAYVSVL